MADKDMAGKDPAAPEDFAAALDRLEALVSQLESGELSLEQSLTAFEQGVRLTRDAQRRLDEAELKVRALVEQPDGTLAEIAFDTPTRPTETDDDV